MILEGDNAVLANRKLMGATNPKDADENTIRKSIWYFDRQKIRFMAQTQ